MLLCGVVWWCRDVVEWSCCKVWWWCRIVASCGVSQKWCLVFVVVWSYCAVVSLRGGTVSLCGGVMLYCVVID